jgi:hypothetical protein
MKREIRSLEARVAYLERENRRLKFIGISVLVLAAAATVWGQGEPARVVQAGRFELRDPKGRMRADLSILEGRPAIRFLDEDGDVKSIAVENDLVYFKKGGDLLASYGFKDLRFEDGHGKTLVNLTGDELKGSVLGLLTAGGKTATIVKASDLAKIGKTTPE